VHNRLFHAAKAMLPFRAEEQIYLALRAAVENCGRDVSDREIGDAICNARPYVWRAGEALGRAGGRWPKLNANLRRDIIARTDICLNDLGTRSPFKLVEPASE